MSVTLIERDVASDHEFVQRMAAGDDGALGGLYDRHAATVYALCRAITGNDADAEEAAADTFAQAWRTALRFDPTRGNVAAWLVTIARTRALDLLRARGRRARTLAGAARGDPEGLAAPVAPAASPERDAEREEARRLVQRSLAELPEPQRRVLELAYFEGHSQSEIAAMLSEPLGTVKTRMRAGLEKLRGALAPLLVGGGA